MQETLKFNDHRLKGGKFLAMKELVRTSLCGRMEWTRKSGYFDPYSAVTYFKGDSGLITRPPEWNPTADVVGTEAFGTGVEQMFRNAPLMAVTDPAFFDLIWRLMHG